MDPLAIEKAYVAGLTGGDIDVVDRLLADDYVMIDTLSGSEVPKHVLIPLLRSRELIFDSLDLADVKVRHLGDVALVTGASQMTGSYAGNGFQGKARYTHVMHKRNGRWLIVAAQGTPRRD